MAFRIECHSGYRLKQRGDLMKRKILHKITTIAASASIAFLGGTIATHSANAATANDGHTELQNASQTQMKCHRNQGDPIGRQCQGRHR
jgi:hypothetical protein